MPDQGSFPILRSDRLLLRAPTLEDAPAIFEAYGQDPEVTRYLIWRPHQTVADTEHYLRLCQEWIAEGDRFPWAIESRESGHLLGMIDARILNEKEAGFGYVLARSEWGKGYMTEALKLVIDWLWTHPNVKKISSVYDVDNPASGRVMEKAGMTFDKRIPRFSVHPNISAEPRDIYRYVIMRPESPQTL